MVNARESEYYADYSTTKKSSGKTLTNEETDENHIDSRPFRMFTSEFDVKLFASNYGAGLEAPGGMR
jgi:hypothetical protein